MKAKKLNASYSEEFAKKVLIKLKETIPSNEDLNNVLSEKSLQEIEEEKKASI